MQLDLTETETIALLKLIKETIEADRYPLSPGSGPCGPFSRSSVRWHPRHVHPQDRPLRRSTTLGGDRVGDLDGIDDQTFRGRLGSPILARAIQFTRWLSIP
jgi:hypothetical protein